MTIWWTWISRVLLQHLKSLNLTLEPFLAHVVAVREIHHGQVASQSQS